MLQLYSCAVIIYNLSIVHQPSHPSGRRPARRARGVHALGFACMHACCCVAARGGLPGMHWHLLGWLAGWLLIIPPICVSHQCKSINSSYY
jgi:hypothetical protein